MSDSGSPHTPTRLTLEEVSVLCREITALSRAGIPLDRGLRKMAQQLPKRLAGHMNEWSERLSAGEPLGQVLSDSGHRLPPTYHAIVESGLRSGRLTPALEQISALSRHYVEIRQAVTTAMLYPLLLLVLLSTMGYLLMVNYNQSLLAFREFQLAEPTGLTLLAQQLMRYAKWLWVVPASLSVLIMIWWVGSRRSNNAAPNHFRSWMLWVPGVGGLLRSASLCTFTSLLRTLLLQEVPLHEALELAGHGSGNRAIAADCQRLSTTLQAGGKQWSHSGKGGLPPLIGWTLQRPQHPTKLLQVLQRSEDNYRRRLKSSVAWLQTYLPMIMTLGIGGTMTALYALSILGNFYGLMHALAGEMELY